MVVVVHVHARVLEAALIEVLDERLRLCCLLPFGVRPPRLVDPLAAVALREQTEQEEQPRVGSPEGVAFVVQEDVAVVGLWERNEPGLHLLGRRIGQGVVRRHRPLRHLAGPHLQLSLRGQACPARRPEVVDLRRVRGERGHGADTACLEELPLGSTDAGDELEGVGGSPLGRAQFGELAEVAVAALDRRRRLVLWLCLHHGS